MATQWDNLTDNPEIKEGYDNEYMRMFVKQFALHFLEGRNQPAGKPHDIPANQQMDASIAESQR